MKVESMSTLLLWLIVLVTLGLTLRLLQWVRKVERLEPVEDNFGPELELGAPAPTFRARLLTGERVSEQSFSSRDVVYVFLSPNCPSCDSTLVQLQPFCVAADRAGCDLVVVSDSGRKRTTAWLAKIQSDGVRLATPIVIAPERESRMISAYDGPGYLPYFCLVDRGGTVGARGVVGRESWLALTQEWAARPSPSDERSRGGRAS